MSLRVRLALGLTTLVLLSSVCAGAGLFFLGQVNRSVERMYTQEVVALEALDDVKSALYRIRGDALEHILAASPASETRLAGEIAEQQRRVQERLVEYRSTRLSEQERALLQQFVTRFEVYTQRVDGDILPRSAAGDKDEAEQLARGEAVEEFRSARESMNDLMDYALRNAERRSQQAREIYRTSVVALLLVAVTIALLGRSIGSRLSRSILEPLRELVVHFRRIGSGDLTQPVPNDRTDEIGEVLLALGSTQRRLRETEQERVEALGALGENERRFRTAFEKAPVGMAIVDLDKWWREVNGALCAMLGRSAAELTMPGGDVGHPEDAHVEDELLRASLAAAAMGDTKPGVVRDKRFLHRDGHVVLVELSAAVVLGRSDRPAHCLLQLVDVTQARRSRAELEQVAHYDPLTGLPNRSLLLRRLDAVASSQQGDLVSGVLFIDLDRFKFVNDVLGHRAGDELLVHAARQIEGCVRTGDTVARFGGDEFIVLLPDMRTPAEASEVADRILSALRVPVLLAGHQIVTSASIGITHTVTDQTGARLTADDLLHDADVAMYEAKTAGKDCFRVAGPEQRARSLARLGLEADLRTAVEDGGLVVHYQPIVELDGRQVVGCEALVRWQHPRRGMLPPSEFLELAEETGLIVPLGRWVLSEACSAVRRWEQAQVLPHDFTLHVNISAQQLRSGLLEELDDVLSTTGIAPERLCLELTETLLAYEDDTTDRLLSGVRSRGVRWAIDDFGKDYSSLGRLKRLPLSCLKIDRSFVAHLPHDRSDAAIVQAVTGLARTMALDSVAEGVETLEQAAAVEQLGCSLAQGYLFGRPAPEDDMRAALAVQWQFC